MQDNVSLDGAEKVLGGKLNLFTQMERATYLKRYGNHSQAFSTMQPNMQYFDIPNIGYIAFAVKYGVVVTLGEPVCDSGTTKHIIHAFLNRYPNAVFLQVEERVINILHKYFGYYGTPFGTETKVSLKNWKITGKSKKTLRLAVNQAKKQGIEIREVDRLIKENTVSEDWLATRACQTEIHFLVRPLSTPYQQDVRYFYAFDGDKPIGFIVFDPIYHNGSVVSYIPNISRANASFKQGLWYAIQLHAMEKFKEEGLEYADLGLSPLSQLDKPGPVEASLCRKLLGLTYRYGSFLYNFKGLEFTKQRFKGDIERTYIGHRYRFPLIAFIATFRQCRLM